MLRFLQIKMPAINVGHRINKFNFLLKIYPQAGQTSHLLYLYAPSSMLYALCSMLQSLTSLSLNLSLPSPFCCLTAFSSDLPTVPPRCHHPENRESLSLSHPSRQPS